jgi:hypothetical protein
MRRLRTRLNHLETDSGNSALSARAQKSLVDLLGRRDALFWPWRCTVDPKHLDPMPGIFLRQRAYLERSEGTLLKADGKGDWKLAQAVRAELLACKMVDAILSSGQVTSLLITSTGEATARSLVGSLYACDDVAILWERLQRLSSERSPVSESRLFGQSLHGDPSTWDYWIESLLPLLTCGAVRATSTTTGSMCFSITGQALPPTPSAEVNSIPDAELWYLQAFDRERRYLDSLEGGCDLFIPLPAGTGE